MKHAGHSQHFRETVAKKAIRKYEAQLEDHKAGKKRFYRNREEIKMDEERRGGKARKDNWFRDGGYTSTLRVVPSPKSQLAQRTNEALVNCPPPDGTKTKVLEQGGCTVGRQLIKSNPFPKSHCDRRECGLCQGNGSSGRCYQPSVGYEYVCSRCELSRQEEIQNGTRAELTKTYRYIGETSRTTFTRHTQHLSKYRSASKNKERYSREKEEEGETSGTFMWSHTRDHHAGNLGPDEGSMDFEMSLNGVFQDTMTRQVDEDIRMRLNGWGQHKQSRGESTPVCVLMNSKTAFYNPKSVQTIFLQL